MDPAPLVDRMLAGDRRALARLLSIAEDGSPQQRRDMVARLHPHTGRARLVGLTGPPGVGKSTIADSLVGHWRRDGQRVAVLAVDPSSPFSGGALLGDRVRMQQHVLDDGVFVRSMASRGHLGGVSAATPHGLAVLDAAGFDVVVVETVGVGQAEVEVAALADTTVVVLAPGMGDAVQAAKAGILEVADVLCVNKADRQGAERTVADLREMQRLGGHGRHDAQDTGGGWLAPVCLTTAGAGEGIADLTAAIDDHGRWLAADGRLQARRVRRSGVHVRELAVAALRASLREDDDEALLWRLAQRVAAGDLDPYSAADALLPAGHTATTVAAGQEPGPG